MNSKFHLKEIEKLPITTFSRNQDDSLLNHTFKMEVYNMDALCNETYERYCN